MSFYDYMIQQRLRGLSSDLGSTLRNKIWGRLNSENLDLANRYANYSTVETCILAQAAAHLLEVENPAPLQIVNIRGNDPDITSKHFLKDEVLDKYIADELEILLDNITSEIDNTYLFPFGVDTEDTFDKDGKPIKHTNMRSLGQVKELAQELRCNWVVMFDCYLDRASSSERVASSAFGSSWSDFHRIDPKQHSRIFGRVFVMTNSSDAVRFLSGEYQSLIFNRFSLPVVVESAHTSGYARKWWVFQIPLDN